MSENADETTGTNDGEDEPVVNESGQAPVEVGNEEASGATPPELVPDPNEPQE